MNAASKNKTDRNGESGNVLFLILIAVALFAALSYAVTQSSRSGGGDAASETNLINSSTITQYPAGIRTALVRMIVSSGVTADELSFNTPSDFGAGLPIDDTDVDTSDEAAAVFHPRGGGATYALAPADVMAGTTAGTWHFNGNFEIPQLGTSGAGGNEVVAILPDVARAICLKLNAEYGITAGTADGAAPGVPAVEVTDASVIDDHLAVDALLPATDQEDIDNATNDLRGQPFGCFYDPSLTQYIYYHALLER